jgi:hypothetical protein
VQVHWAYRSLAEISRIVWATKAAPPRHLATVNRAAPAKPGYRSHAPVDAFTVASVSHTLRHMHHVLNALRHAMLHTALYTAWHHLSEQIDRATAVASNEDSCDDAVTGALSVDDLLHLHSEYLSVVETACWLNGSPACQVWRAMLQQTTASLPSWPLHRSRTISVSIAWTLTWATLFAARLSVQCA